MKDLLDKLTSYNLFNYLLPGVIFATLVEELTTLKLIQASIVIGVFVYYFLGLIISRIGSLVIEPALKKVGFLKFASYTDFLQQRMTQRLNYSQKQTTCIGRSAPCLCSSLLSKFTTTHQRDILSLLNLLHISQSLRSWHFSWSRIENKPTTSQSE